MISLDQFIAQNNGKSLDYDGYYGSQCVDLIEYYIQDVFGLGPFYADAKDWYYNFGGNLATKFDRITNDPNDFSQAPSRGDIIIWNGNTPGSGGYGHIAIFLERLSPGNFKSFDQNWGGMYCHEVSHNYNYILGWLTPKIPPAPPASLQPFQRRIGSNGVNYRKAPNTSAEVIKEYEPGEILDFKGFVKGGVFNGNNIWFVGKYTSGYSWSGSFDDTGTHDLPDLTEPTAPAPQPTPSPAPSPQPIPTFPKELPSVTKVIPPHPTNFEVGNFPAKPTKVVIHDFGTDGRDTLQSSLNQFQNSDTTSPHFTVSKNERIQNVSLKNRAYHAGPKGNDFVGIESDPAQDPETVTSVRMILDDLEKFYGYRLEPIKHSSVAATLCGDDINLDDYKPTPPTPVPTPPSDPSSPPEPVPVDPTPTDFKKIILAVVTGIAALVAAVYTWLHT